MTSRQDIDILEGMANSSVALVTAILVGVAIFGLGYFANAFRGARKTLIGAKGGVPAARKSYWMHLWLLIRFGALAVGILFVLVTWTVRDAPAGNSTPAPSASAGRR